MVGLALLGALPLQLWKTRHRGLSVWGDCRLVAAGNPRGWGLQVKLCCCASSAARRRWCDGDSDPVSTAAAHLDHGYAGAAVLRAWAAGWCQGSPLPAHVDWTWGEKSVKGAGDAGTTPACRGRRATLATPSAWPCRRRQCPLHPCSSCHASCMVHMPAVLIHMPGIDHDRSWCNLPPVPRWGAAAAAAVTLPARAACPPALTATIAARPPATVFVPGAAAAAAAWRRPRTSLWRAPPLRCVPPAACPLAATVTLLCRPPTASCRRLLLLLLAAGGVAAAAAALLVAAVIRAGAALPFLPLLLLCLLLEQ